MIIHDIESITDEEMMCDYDLWLARNGYIQDNEFAQEEYQAWLAEMGVRI